MPAIPEINVQDLDAKLRSKDGFILLDVRESWELESARIQDHRLVLAPMSVLGQLGTDGLPAAAQDREAEIFVLCHHGTRSAQVAAWLSARGWKRAFSVSGGIDDYARKIDKTVGSY
jgi:rhodanese-related sulfurtransferase